MKMFAGDMNGYIGSSNVGYDGTIGGFGYSSRNTDGSRILEFADGLNLVICNTLFTKQEAKLVTYVAGLVKSTVDCIMVRQEDKAKVRNVKVISSQECVPKHKLLVMDMWFNATKSWRRKFEPRVRVLKLKQEKTCEEYRCMVRDKVKKGNPYSITERRVPQLIPILGRQPAGDLNHKPDGRLPLLSARPAVTPATLKRAATNFCCLGVNSLPKTVTRQCRDCDLNPGSSAPESNTLTTPLPSHPEIR